VSTRILLGADAGAAAAATAKNTTSAAAVIHDRALGFSMSSCLATLALVLSLHDGCLLWEILGAFVRLRGH
jgi:hypothetical protein